jgi:hypothetical protein
VDSILGSSGFQPFYEPEDPLYYLLFFLLDPPVYFDNKFSMADFNLFFPEVAPGT